MNKKTSFKLNALYTAMVLLSAHNASAANFTIAPFGTLPTTVITGETVSAYYTVTNMTNTVRNGYTLQGFPTTVTQNTTVPNCGNPINLGAHASCQLQLDITGAVSSNFSICKGNSCTTATTPLNVSLNSTPIAPTARYIYITQYDSVNSVLVCPLNETTGLFVFGDCVDADPEHSLAGTYPQGIVINKAGTMAYTAGVETDPYQCPIDQATGVFTSGCTSTSLTGSFYYYPYYGMLDLDPSNANVYLSNYSDAEGLDIIKCPITDGNIVNDCTASAKLSNSGSSYGAGIVVNKANTNVYASMYSIPQVGICSVSSWGSVCDLIDGVNVNSTNTNFSDEAGLALNPDNSILYIADSGSYQVYGCNPSNISGGYFSSCFVATDTTNSGRYPWGLTINAKNTFTYFTDYIDTVYACPITQDGHFPFNTCTEITGFIDPVSTALLY